MFETIKNKTMHNLIRYLSIFRICYEQNGLRKGAAALSMTFGNVSKSISNLEEALNLVIIDPKKKKNIFTEEAKLLYECACKSEDLINLLVQDFISINKIQNKKENHLKLNVLVHSSFLNKFIKSMKTFLEINKDLSFTINTSESQDKALLQIDSKVIDFAIFPFESEIRDAYLTKNHFRECGSYQYFIYYNKNDQLLTEKLKHISKEELVSGNLIPNVQNRIYNFHKNKNPSNTSNKINIECENINDNLQFVNAGIGYLIAPDIEIQDKNNIVKKDISNFKILEDKVYVAVERGHINKKIIIDFVDHIKSTKD